MNQYFEEVLTIEGYLAYKSGNAIEGTKAYYEIYDASLTETLGEGIYDDIIKDMPTTNVKISIDIIYHVVYTTIIAREQQNNPRTTVRT